jgi:hypothetical protein
MGRARIVPAIGRARGTCRQTCARAVAHTHKGAVVVVWVSLTVCDGVGHRKKARGDGGLVVGRLVGAVAVSQSGNNSCRANP